MISESAMQPLRLRYWWLSGGILLVVAVLYLTLMPVIGGIFTVNVDDKIGHFIAFFVLMAWFCGVYKRGRWLKRNLVNGNGYSFTCLQYGCCSYLLVWPSVQPMLSFMGR